jgi:hypothetical protein
MIAPMLPQPPPFVRCGECRGFYWLDEATPIGELPGPFDAAGDEDMPEWASAPQVEEPTESGYHEALDSGSTDPSREAKLRILAWQRGNDVFREGATTDEAGERTTDAPERAEVRRLNLDALVGLFDHASPSELVMKAAALRELGRFDEALAVLGRVEGENHAEIVSILRRYCEAGDSDLHEL